MSVRRFVLCATLVILSGMKYLLIVFLVLLNLSLVMSQWSPMTLAKTDLSDIADSEYRESIEALWQIGVIQGYGNGEFRPEQPINRAELLKVVFQALDESSVEADGHCFPDVKDEWFAPFICRAKELNIVKGYSDGYYRPGQDVNMAEALKIAMEAFDMPVDEDEEGEVWYSEYIDFAHMNNIFSKYAYYPERPARREEVVFLVHKLLQIKDGEAEISKERDVRSSGCGEVKPAQAPTTFMVNGVERKTITVVPSSYNPDEPIALIFAFHGRTNSNEQARKYFGIERPSSGKAIVVYPAGLSNGGGYSWSDGGDSADELRDYEFFDAMVEEFKKSYCVNVDEIYAVGHSLGGWFVNSLACARGDVLRAVGTLGGGRSQGNCSGPVAAMQWHNPNDNLVPFSQAITAHDWYLEQNRCTEVSKETVPYWGNCVAYQGCYEGAPFVWCPHTIDYEGGGYYPHTWPKGTGEEMWKFFEGL